MNKRLSPSQVSDSNAASRKEAIRRCIGTTCYGALAAHFGTDSSKKLELRIDRLRAQEPDGEIYFSNKFRRWLQGAIPSDDSISHIKSRSAGAVNLDKWVHLPLWELLSYEPPSIRRLHEILEMSPPNIRRILFVDEYPDKDGRFFHHDYDRDTILALRNVSSLEALTALLCLTRRGEIREDDSQHLPPAICAYDILPRVLYANHPLRYRWEQLFNCLTQVFWSRVYLGGHIGNFTIERIRTNLQELDLDPSMKLEFSSWKRNRIVDNSINDDFLATKREIDQIFKRT